MSGNPLACLVCDVTLPAQAMRHMRSCLASSWVGMELTQEWDR
jgi:hypothetical protein